jgi:serine/threonine-protein kinase
VLIGRRFRVERELGEGAMGRVVAARNIELDYPVALKLLRPEFKDESARRARLVREARAAAKIRSAHVARVFDVVAEGPDAPFIVMELLEGEDLAARLEARGKLSTAEVLEIVAQLGEALGEAHAIGIVHRDVKPRNVFVVRQINGSVLYKLLDLGIAHLSGPEVETLTSSQQILGSPAYASPEQLRAASEVSPAMDIWSLGVLIYECLTGVRPFEGETLAQLCVQILEREPLLPSQRNAEIPPQIDELVMRCLAKLPQDRFASVAELLHACAPLAPASSARSIEYLRNVDPTYTSLPVGKPAAHLALGDVSLTDLARGEAQTLAAAEPETKARTSPLQRSLDTPSSTPGASTKRLQVGLSLAVAAAAIVLGMFLWQRWHSSQALSAPAPESDTGGASLANALLPIAEAPTASNPTRLAAEPIQEPSGSGVASKASSQAAATVVPAAGAMHGPANLETRKVDGKPRPNSKSNTALGTLPSSSSPTWVESR